MTAMQGFILGAAVTAAIFTVAIVAAMRRVLCWNVVQHLPEQTKQTERSIMKRPLQEHIRFLEERILDLTALATLTSTEQERNRLQSEILIAEEALVRYREAFDLEQKIA